MALRLQLDSWRWAGVPFYLRTGKRLPKRTTEIAIQFHRPPLQIFKRVSPDAAAARTCWSINVQPDEGISLRFNAKIPGTRMQVAPVMMNFRYGTSFQGEVPEAYETLLLDAMLGDPTLFARHDFVEASWALITPINELWQTESGRPSDLRGRRMGTPGSRCAHRKGWPPMENAVAVQAAGSRPYGHGGGRRSVATAWATSPTSWAAAKMRARCTSSGSPSTATAPRFRRIGRM